jgi:hypothetical protein
VGLGVDGRAYVLEDLSGRFGPGGPQGWGKIVGSAFDRHGADRVVAETNFGGDMVHEVIRVARPGTPFKKVTASRTDIGLVWFRELGRQDLTRWAFSEAGRSTLWFHDSRICRRQVARSRGCPLLALAELFPILAKPQKKVIPPEPVVHRYPSRYAWMG